MNRRDFLKVLAVGAGAVCLGGVKAFAQDQRRQSTGGGGTLSAFFSKTGNTRAVAEEIQRNVGGNLFHITTATPYPENYQQTVDMAGEEQRNNARPQIVGTVDNMESYSTIYLGYPNWWGTVPMAVFTFLEQYDFSGKTIAPFCTHEGSGLGRGPADIQRICPQASLVQGLAVRGGSATSAQRDVAGWLRQIGAVR